MKTPNPILDLYHGDRDSNQGDRSYAVVLYARYSTDQQNPASIETQLDLRKEYVLRQGWHLADTFVDAGVSGSSFEARPGLQAALAGANIGAYDVFLCLTLDRLFPRP
ncbi:MULTISPECIES: recombinase family protein [unclassified Rhizobium]|uniref:recombinase family protein n=1 Tax=unclassified Rhizobium TaxID=2613769 RepID=UPI00161FF425|nr:MULTISPECIES: recombinase family protein [unclassified Rhizobium]MBB3302788.1 DNA invertase Pin-like site-specific DNA recombinase [Rhizobium sp. BK112]MBB4182532.1 DNA invertase Pin-like site-specific DNA recombinase [Rhizobium sp. BK109]